MMGSLLTRLLLMVFGYVYPADECFKSMEKDKPEIDQLLFWCHYWILLALLTTCERVGDLFMSWLPLYGEAKFALCIYLWYPRTRVLNEFTHGKQEKVSKKEFKEVLSDILLGMAAGLKRDPIVILRIDGEDLLEFLKSPSFEQEVLSVFSEIELPNASLQDYIIKALEKLTVEQGVPPASDSWVRSNIVEPALQSCGGGPDQPVSQETFVGEFKNVAETVAKLLKDQPVIVAHTENTFDGSGIRGLLCNKFELDKALDTSIQSIPKDSNGNVSKDYLRVALDVLAPSSGLPPLGAVDQIDKIINEAFKMLDSDDEKLVKDVMFKKFLTEILGNIMLQLEGNPISVSTNSVVHEPLASSSTLLEVPPS
ncbi:hypothetical protein ACH5RR_021970 [Cinchona calisaya]|uniref:HVA22-like protein n=1 Tax=Cinchona calisaya TaxID=153742 RepID=A0ABD2Z6G9_9GENT